MLCKGIDHSGWMKLLASMTFGLVCRSCQYRVDAHSSNKGAECPNCGDGTLEPTIETLGKLKIEYRKFLMEKKNVYTKNNN